MTTRGEASEARRRLHAATIGKLGVAPESRAGANTARAVSRIIPHAVVDRDYLVIVMQSPAFQSFLSDATRTLAQPTLNIGQLATAPVPLPPLAEQKRIVAKVEQLLALCDELETRLKDADARRARLLTAAIESFLETG